MNMEIRATRNPAWAGDGVDIRIFNRETREVAESLQIRVAKMGAEIPVAAHLDCDKAQQLMDNLWDCGFRPTEGTGSAGALAAVERHLADMKKVAFHALKIQ